VLVAQIRKGYWAASYEAMNLSIKQKGRTNIGTKWMFREREENKSLIGRRAYHWTIEVTVPLLQLHYLERLCASKGLLERSILFIIWKFGCCIYLFQVVREASDRSNGNNDTKFGRLLSIMKKATLVLAAVCYLDATPLLVLLHGFLGSRKGV
jgi:hypothetical protein